jgi:hypothetical protein
MQNAPQFRSYAPKIARIAAAEILGIKRPLSLLVQEYGYMVEKSGLRATTETTFISIRDTYSGLMTMTLEQ